MSKRAELRMVWSKREQDYVYHYDRRPQDGHLLHNLLTYGAGFVIAEDGELAQCGTITGSELVQRLRAELERRGYDPNTLTISVRRRRSPAAPAAREDRG